MDYNKLSEVNKGLNPIDVKDKPYVQVHGRIQGFWQLYPNGRIISKVDELNLEYVRIHTEVYDGEILLTTGNAIEFRGDGPVNRYGYVENCETSAVGRALGILGIGNCAIASADEVQHKIALAEESIEENNKLLAEARALGINIPEVHKWAEGRYGITPSDRIPNEGLKLSISKRKEANALNANAPASK